MAGAFTQYYAGDRIEVESAGSAPAKEINPTIKEVMGEKGLDMAFCIPKSIDDATPGGEPDLVVTMGCGDSCPMFPEAKNVAWDLPDPAGKPIEFMRDVRDEIEKRVKELISSEERDSSAKSKRGQPL